MTMKKNLKLTLFLFFLIIASCESRDKEIKRLLSDKPTEIIVDAREAGDTGDKKYVPLLLRNAKSPSASTSLTYKGFTVYTEVMFALESIFKVSPPHPYKNILMLPDSVNIKFYATLWQNMKKRK
jgi:hypothetical protein